MSNNRFLQVQVHDTRAVVSPTQPGGAKKFQVGPNIYRF